MSVVYRPIGPSDQESVAALALRALRPAATVPLRLDEEKVRRMVLGFAVSPEHFNMAAFEDGQAVGGICAYLVDSPIFERGEAHVAMCFAEKPGTGCALIGMMLKALAANPQIMRICWMMNDPAEDAVSVKFGAMLQRRYGFTGRHDNLVRYTHRGN